MISLQELGILVPDTGSGGIETLLLAPGMDTLFVVYADGYVREWNLETNKEVSRFDVGFVAYQATSFSSDGRYLITPSAIVTQAVESDYEVFPAVESIYLWDTQTGQQVDCFGFTCDPTFKHSRSMRRGAVLSPDGRWLVEYVESGLSFNDLRDQLPSVITSLENPDHRSYRHISRVAFDPSGSYYTVAYEEGEVELYDFDDAVMDRDNWTRVRTLGQSDGESLPVRSLIIDDTRSWLASLRGKSIDVWKLQAGSRKPFTYEVVRRLVTIS